MLSTQSRGSETSAWPTQGRIMSTRDRIISSTAKGSRRLSATPPGQLNEEIPGS
jgi:hypothetical protein